VGQQWRSSSSRADSLDGPAQKKDADQTSHPKQLCGSRAHQGSARYERSWGDRVGQHSCWNSKEKLRAERYGSQGSDERSVHACASIGKVGQVQPDKHRARSTGNPHQGVAQQRDREAVTRADQCCGVCPGPRLIFHNHRIHGSMVSGNDSFNLTENADSGKQL
jgi:hypothetical protein